ncbi:hypothetical protein [Streptomyces rimosus]|uniref:hypothetical protein n=1 Tax=Streptomyces rimosus TaxID=1927 RepID=UPI000B077A21|nr:hypothetical protein [Streptomyces rimosus]
MRCPVAFGEGFGSSDGCVHVGAGGRAPVLRAGPDDPRPGQRPGRTYAELAGGPLDSLLLDVTGWTPDELATGAALMTELGQFGAGGRALYDPRPADAGRWDWGGDIP